MAGGSGTRLWPLSRASYPKQFLSLHGERSLLQQTVLRSRSVDFSSLLFICNENHRFLLAEQLREIDKLDTIILEPVSKNTAPAIALAALNSLEQDSILFVLPSDSFFEDQKSFENSITDAIPFAESGKLVTFGIEPNLPHTGFGYIKKGKSSGSAYVVDKFIEKPSIENAKNYLSTEQYLWNSGMFMFKASRYLEELKKFRPDILKVCESSMSGIRPDLDFLRIDEEQFLTCPAESIDHAVMEKTKDAVVIPINTNWSDVGSWPALWDLSSKDTNGNSSHGDVILHNSKNSYIRSDDRLVVAMGVNDLVIMDTKDALLVANKDDTQDLKVIAQKLKSNSRSEWQSHREVYRPWGKYDSIDKGEGFQVKRITVKPEEKLSLQMHQHRSEHWIVVSGRAKVTKGDKSFFLCKNEATYIPAGTIHSLENPDDNELKLIEIQLGTYLGEDDIVRFDDKYGRELS
jgi:mannose-1-phosphate guanylyltransferase